METVSTARPAALSAAVGEVGGTSEDWVLDNALPRWKTCAILDFGRQARYSCAIKNQVR